MALFFRPASQVVRMYFARRFVAICSAACLAVLAHAGADAGQPSAEFQLTEANFGAVPQGTVVEQAFPITNSGTSVLRIERVELDSTGMKIKVRQEIAPGASEDLRISWDTSGYAGEAIGHAVLHLNDPQRPRVLLTLQGQVAAPVEILPQPAFYLSQFVGEEITKSLLLRNNRERPLTVQGIERRGTHFTARYAVEEPGKTYQVLVTVPADTPAGRYRESLTVLTDDPDNSRLHVEVNVLVKPPVFANPETLEFGTLSLARLRRDPGLLDLVTQTSVISRQQGAMRITAIDSDIPFLSTRLEPGAAAERFQLDVSLNLDSMTVGPFDGQLTLHTDDPGFPLLKIPVSGVITD